MIAGCSDQQGRAGQAILASGIAHLFWRLTHNRTLPLPSLPALCPSCPPCAGKRATGDLFAIKVMRKADLIRKNMVQSVKNERNILAMANNPFVVRGYSSAWHAMEWNA